MSYILYDLNMIQTKVFRLFWNWNLSSKLMPQLFRSFSI